MSIFYGTEGLDEILRNSLSPGVTTDPEGLTGTEGEPDPFSYDMVFAYGGDDTVQLGFGRGWEVHGGGGNDRIDGRGTAFVILNGGLGDDTMYGGDSDDAFDTDGIVFPEESLGRDRMIGGLGGDGYFVDNAGDRVVERYGEGRDNINSILDVTTCPLNVEELVLIENGSQAGFGNSQDNFIAKIFGAGTLHGMNGNDTLSGAEESDVFIGGRGCDVFSFFSAAARDVLRAGDGAVAFQGAGAAVGDRIDLAFFDADVTDDEFQAFVLGGTGKGHLSLVNSGRDTLVRGNVDDTAGFEFQVTIKDGRAVRASDYTVDDFILG